MIEDLRRVQSLLQSDGPESGHQGNQGGALEELQDASCRRLARALESRKQRFGTRGPGPADLVVLVANVLRRAAAAVPTSVPSLRVPAAPGWPTAAVWRATSLGAVEERGYFRLTPLPWEPDWLPGKHGAAMLDPIYAEAPRRQYDFARGDPFLRVVGRTVYRSTGQRDAIRAILSAPDSATLVVNLPTGAGKSLCAHLPALLLGEPAGTTVVVVPTIALALDQERSLDGLVDHPTAYIGGTSPLVRQRNGEIRARLREGTQRILFTSPEGLTTTLRPALYEAARRGLVPLFVIDEAHIVEQWGTDFRESFQEVAGLRVDLLRSCPSHSPFRTVLLSATLSELSLDTLEALFGEPGPFDVISAAQLRPEPSYWVVRLRDEAAKARAVLDALGHLPRPAILYVTEPEVARAWSRRLRAAGYARIDEVTGATPNEQRADVVRRWRAGDTDLVVATSAFGLGVDQQDVRAVLHASLPENLDRFYQEVGRGGRDGNACVSLLLYTDEDYELARDMNHRTVIGVERGLERWTQMFGRAEPLPGGRIRVPVWVPPGSDIDMSSPLNRAWNIRTLTLMSRAHLLGLDAEPPPGMASFASQSDEGANGSVSSRNGGESFLVAQSGDDDAAWLAYRKALDEQREFRVVRLRHAGTTLSSVWEESVEPVRRAVARADLRGFEQMKSFLRGGTCVADVLADAYRIPARGGKSPRRQVTVSKSCGGCPWCRARGVRPYAGAMPLVSPEWPVPGESSLALDELTGSSGAAAVFFDVISRAQRSRSLKWFTAQGIRMVIAPPGMLDEIDADLAALAAIGRFVFTFELERFRSFLAPALPALAYVPDGEPIPRSLVAWLSGPAAQATRLLVASARATDPAAPHRHLVHTLQCRTYRFEELNQRIGL